MTDPALALPRRRKPGAAARSGHPPSLVNMVVGLALSLSLAVPAAAQAPAQPAPYQRAIAAGYKALTLCSALFNAKAAGARRTVRSVEANELAGIYTEYDPLIAAMKATVGKSTVTVPFAPDMPPRVAHSGVDAGCSIYPIGTPPAENLGDLVFLPKPAGAPWPAGDADGIVRPIASLKPIVARSFDRRSYGQGANTTAIVVVKNGRLVAESYAPGFGPATPQRTWSVAKSLAGALIGAAVQRGMLTVDAPAPIPEWRDGDPRRLITTDQLLRMSSGLHSSTAGNRTDAVYFGGTAVTEETVAWPLEAEPGTRFRYANNDILLATRALRAQIEARSDLFPTMGGNSERFAESLLLRRLGMHRTYPETDWRGNYVLSSQVWSTARDLARFGQFMLQDGVWQGQRLLPPGWMADSLKPLGPQPASGPGYGRTLWLFGPAQGLPAGSYAAQGNRGQYVMVVPSERLVVVRRGEDPGPARFDVARFTADVIAAVR